MAESHKLAGCRCCFGWSVVTINSHIVRRAEGEGAGNLLSSFDSKTVNSKEAPPHPPQPSPAHPRNR